MGVQPRNRKKKLIAWARYYWSADGVGPGYCTDCKKARDSESHCEQCPKPELLPENDEAVVLFDAVQTQWLYRGNDVLKGLDYAGVKAAADLMSISDTQNAFAKVRVLENEVLTIDREKLEAASEAVKHE